ncbi:MAG: hypothetical protein GQE15_28015 [Archangiaceae bacterium]|nr:hypothetical protein [Archangiaceae bacterium]
MAPRLKLEKLKSPVAFPSAVARTERGLWLSSHDRPYASASGPWVLSFSSDLGSWREVLRHSTALPVLCAFGGVVVRGWPEATDVRWSVDGATWSEVLLPKAGVRLAEDGAEGLWAFDGTGAWRRRRDATTFEPAPLEFVPDRLVACASSTFFGQQGRWLLGESATPIPTLKRVQLQQAVSIGDLVLVRGDGVWFSKDGGRSFVAVSMGSREALHLAVVGAQFVIGCRGALLAGDGASFTPVSENDQAEFASVVGAGGGALIVDPRRARLFSLSENGAALAFGPAAPPAPAVNGELAEVEALLAAAEAPLLAKGEGSLDALRAQAQRSEPRGGWQPHLVYLDALQDAGDPDASVMAALNRLQQGPQFDKHLAAHLFQLVAAPILGRVHTFKWRGGFIDSASVAPAQIAPLLERPSGHLLRQLHVSGVDDGGDVSVLGRALRGLHRLVLDGFVWSDDDVLEGHEWGDLSTLWPALGQLRTLQITGAVSRLGRLLLPRCDRLTLAVDQLPSVEVPRTPGLRVLELAWQGGAAGAWLSSWLERPMPALEVVRLAGQLDEVAAVLVRSGLVATCEALDLSGSELSDAGLDVLASVPWPALRSVDLRWNRLTSAGLERARRFAPAVKTEHQAADSQLLWPPNWAR